MPVISEAVVLRVIDAVLNFTDVARGFRQRRRPPAPGTGGAGEEPIARRGERPGSFEAQLSSVIVAALKETFDRDRERTELERQQFECEREQREADRRRADEALRLELVRQAGERETSRLRLLAFVAVVVWVITAAFLGRIAGANLAARGVFAAGWFCLLLGLGALFMSYRALNERLAPGPPFDAARVSTGRAGAAADWLVLAGALLSGASLVIAIF